ncbi:Asp/Glu racemase [Chloroflexota bacterium]
MYGWRARLGILVPSGIVVTEPEFREMTPDGVSCHYHRISFQGGGIDNLKKVREGLEEATKLIMHVRPAAMAMAGTGVSFVGGYGYDQQMIQQMKEINGNLPTTTTSSSVIDAFHKLGIKNVSMAMPYGEEVALLAAKFVEDSGIEVLSKKWLGVGAPAVPRDTVPRETVYNLALEADKPDSEAMFIPCVGWHTIEIIEKLEWALQKPVISSNQATMWNLLRLANINDKIEGYGQLLSKY